MLSDDLVLFTLSSSIDASYRPSGGHQGPRQVSPTRRISRGFTRGAKSHDDYQTRFQTFVVLAEPLSFHHLVTFLGHGRHNSLDKRPATYLAPVGVRSLVKSLNFFLSLQTQTRQST